MVSLHRNLFDGRASHTTVLEHRAARASRLLMMGYNIRKLESITQSAQRLSQHRSRYRAFDLAKKCMQYRQIPPLAYFQKPLGFKEYLRMYSVRVSAEFVSQIIQHVKDLSMS